MLKTAPHFIIESPIFQEAVPVKTSAGKARFRIILQTCDELNQNKRVYPRDVLTEGMKECEERMKRRAMLGELDHPVPSGNHDFDAIRQTTVLLKDVSHIINDYGFDGNNLMGEVETTSTPNGSILFGLLKDKSGVGMSLRGMAELERKQDYNVVKGPLTIITFDSVSLPSHKTAVVNFNEVRFEMSMLTESKNLVCTPDGRCFLPNYFDRLVDKKILEFFQRWV